MVLVVGGRCPVTETDPQQQQLTAGCTVHCTLHTAHCTALHELESIALACTGTPLQSIGVQTPCCLQLQHPTPVLCTLLQLSRTPTWPHTLHALEFTSNSASPQSNPVFEQPLLQTCGTFGHRAVQPEQMSNGAFTADCFTCWGV